MTVLSQRSFVGGELSPSVSARADLAKFGTGLATCRNFFVEKHGGLSNRAGSEFVFRARYPNKKTRYIEFIPATGNAFVIEMGDLYMRFAKNGVPVTGLSQAISNITKGASTSINSMAHGLSATDHVTMNVAGIAPLTAVEFGVTITDADNFVIKTTPGGADINSSAYGDFSSGTFQRVYPITSITQAAQGVVTSTAHDLANGDDVQFNVVGMTQLNSVTVKVSDVTADTFKLKYSNGNYVNTTAFGAFLSGYVLPILTITTPFVEADLFQIDKAESVDVMTFAHENYPQQNLLHIADNGWSIAQESRVISVAPPTALSVTAGAAGSFTFTYQVTALNDKLEESLPATGAGTAKTINTLVSVWVSTGGPDGYAAADIGIIAHGYLVGQKFRIDGVTGNMAGLNGRVFSVIKVNSVNSLRIKENVVGKTLAGAPTATLVSLGVNSAIPTQAAPNVITWTASDTATQYNVFKELNGVYGFIGTANGTSFKDTNITPDTSLTPPVESTLFLVPGDYPRAVNYFQQRKAYAGSINKPEDAWLSRTGQFLNFSKSIPTQDDDSIEFLLDGKRINPIYHLLDLGQLLVLTGDAEISARGTSSDAITPSDIFTKRHSSNGSARVAPIVVDTVGIYLQAGGTVLRSLAYDFSSNGYVGSDLTIFSSHLFEGYQITDMAYQKTPHSIVWAVRSDGALLGLTTIREQELLAWHRHDFENGQVESVCVVPEGQNEMLYLGIIRQIDGQTVRYCERMSVRRFTDIAVDCTILDSYLTYDGRNKTATTMTVSGGTTWAAGEPLDLTASAAFFSGDKDNEIVIKIGQQMVRFAVISNDTNTHVRVRADRDVPVAFRGVPVTTWSRAVDHVSGLRHLEAQNVSIFADGFVIASPKNTVYPTITVVEGAVDLQKCFSVIHVGLPMTSDMETLDVEFASAESLVAKKININEVHLKVLNTRGIFYGSTNPDLIGDDALGGLFEAKLRRNENYDSPLALQSERISILIKPEWKSNGRIFGRNVDPIPVNILSVHPEGIVPVRGAG